jgi:chromosome segregation ATPase
LVRAQLKVLWKKISIPPSPSLAPPVDFFAPDEIIDFFTQTKSEATQQSLEEYIIRTKSLDDLLVEEKQRATELKASNLSIQTKLDSIQRSLDEHTVRAKSLDNLIVKERQRAEELEDILTKTNYAAEFQLDEYEREMETLRVENKKIQETADAKIANLKASLSWRLTAPLRFIRDNGMQIWKKSTKR